LTTIWGAEVVAGAFYYEFVEYHVVNTLIDLLRDHRDDAQRLVPILSVAIEQGSSVVSWNAVDAVMVFKQDAVQAMPALASRLQDENRRMREKVALSLGSLGPAALNVVPDLIRALADESDEDVQAQIASALSKITGQSFGLSATRWQEWWDDQN
jgi:HEAT repeat protein